MPLLKVMSIQAPNVDPLCAEITAYLGEYLRCPTKFVNETPWQERERRFDAGEIHVGWVCSLPYVQKADHPAPFIELLAAPTMDGARYGGRAVYFSDVVTRAESPFRTFEDLQGAAWAFNEPNSHSGYTITRYFLATRGERNGFFGKIVESGSHQNSLQWLLEKRIDATAIDSTVLETELAAHPQLARRLRRIVTLGPSPIPPWIVHTSVPADIRRALRRAFLEMHRSAAGSEILRRGNIRRFIRVTDADYDPIRMMAVLAETIPPWR